MAQVCEVCGEKLHAPTNRVEIDGAVMMVCNNCARLGRQVGPPVIRAPALKVVRAPSRPMQMAPVRTSDRNGEAEYDIDPDYNVKIKQAREKMGLSQEELGMRINEKPSVIGHLETKKHQPDIVLARKLMHFLKIDLIESPSEYGQQK